MTPRSRPRRTVLVRFGLTGTLRAAITRLAPVQRHPERHLPLFVQSAVQHRPEPVWGPGEALRRHRGTGNLQASGLNRGDVGLVDTWYEVQQHFYVDHVAHPTWAVNAFARERPLGSGVIHVDDFKFELVGQNNVTYDDAPATKIPFAGAGSRLTGWATGSTGTGAAGTGSSRAACT